MCVNSIPGWTKVGVPTIGQCKGTLEALCREHGLGVITYFSLAHGFLTGKYRSRNDLSKSVRGASVEPYLNERGFRILDALDRRARERHQRRFVQAPRGKRFGGIEALSAIS